MENQLATITTDYLRDGYYFPLQAMDEAAAVDCRRQLEDIEQKYASKEVPLKSLTFNFANFVMPFIDEMTRLPAILDPVRAILGPNLMVWGANLFIKEAHTPDFVSWHQDLTYWDLSDVSEVSAWVALSPATVQSGCMRFMPGTHLQDIVAHRDTFAESNMLSRGQELAVDIDESQAVDIELAPGQMSLHHGRIFHGSHANQSDDRRIGLAIRYITPEMHQNSGIKSYVTLVSGEDRHGNFHIVSPPTEAMAPESLAIARQAVDETHQFLYADAEQPGKRA